MNTKNALKTAAASIAVVLTGMLATGTASAETVADTGTKTFADCTIRAQVTTEVHPNPWGTSVEVRARGQLACTKQHPNVTMTTQLKMDGVMEHQYKVTNQNWKGTGTDRWYRTDDSQVHFPNDSRTAQAVVTVTLSDVGSTYVTTGAPITVNA